MSRDESRLSPTYLAMSMRKQWSDEHMFEEAGYHTFCHRCGKKRNHPDHVDKAADHAAVKRWRDRFKELHGIE